MKKTINFTVLLLSIILFSAFTISKDKAYDLRLNLHKGDKFYVLATTEQNIIQSMMGQEVKIIQTIVMGYDYEVVDVLDNGDFNIKVTYVKVAFKQDSQYANLDYDSDKDNSEITPQTQAFAALKGATFNFICNNKGAVKEIDGIDKLLVEMIETIGKDLTAEQKLEIENSLKLQFGDEAMKSTLSNTMNIYPENRIKKGESWNRVIDLNVGMPMKLDNTWTLVDVKKDLAQVTVNSKIETLKTDEPMQVQGMEMEYKLTGDQSGTIKLNVLTGLAEESIVNQKIKGTMVLTGEMLPQAMEVPISIETKATVTMSKK